MTKHETVKELPDTEQPYEKCYTRGAEYLSDAELLAVILRTGTNGIRSIELAQNILKIHDKGLLGLYDLSKEELLQIPGIGKVQSDTVKMYCRTEQADQPSFLTGGGNIRMCGVRSELLYGTAPT